MLFKDFCIYLEKIENTSSRLEMNAILAELFKFIISQNQDKQINLDELCIVNYIILGRLTPNFVPLEFNISEKIVLKSLSLALNYSEDELKLKLKNLKDIGDLVYEFKKEVKNELDISIDNNNVPYGTIISIYEQMFDLLVISGKGSVQSKINLIVKFINNLSSIEIKYVIRLILGKLRLGASLKTVLDALSLVKNDTNIDKSFLEIAYGVSNDIARVLMLYLGDNLDKEKFLEIKAGNPIACKLVERESNLENILKRIPNSVIQPKYDGMRCQVHIINLYNQNSSNNQEKAIIWQTLLDKKLKNKDLFDFLNLNKQKDETEEVVPSFNKKYKVELFSRNLERLTDMFPSLVNSFEQIAIEYNLQNTILDCELIGFNEEINQYLAFNDTMKRRRKHNILQKQDEFPVSLFCFDILQFNNKSLLNTPLNERLDILSNFINNFCTKFKNEIKLTPNYYIKTNDLNSEKSLNNKEKTIKDGNKENQQEQEQINQANIEQIKDLKKYFKQAIDQNLEGLIIKDINSNYEPGTRNFKWIKYKKAMDSDMADTLDVVILGYYYGTGRLAKLGIGSLLTGIYDKQKDKFVTLCKLGSGLTEEELKVIKVKCDDIVIIKKDESFDIKNEEILNLPQLVNFDNSKTSIDNLIEIPKNIMPDVLVYPKIVLEVEADIVSESPMHSSGYSIRFPRFKKIREDKSEYDVTSLQEVVEMKGL